MSKNQTTGVTLKQHRNLPGPRKANNNNNSNSNNKSNNRRRGPPAVKATSDIYDDDRDLTDILFPDLKAGSNSKKPTGKKAGKDKATKEKKDRGNSNSKPKEEKDLKELLYPSLYGPAATTLVTPPRRKGAGGGAAALADSKFAGSSFHASPAPSSLPVPSRMAPGTGLGLAPAPATSAIATAPATNGVRGSGLAQTPSPATNGVRGSGLAQTPSPATNGVRGSGLAQTPSPTPAPSSNGNFLNVLMEADKQERLQKKSSPPQAPQMIHQPQPPQPQPQHLQHQHPQHPQPQMAPYYHAPMGMQMYAPPQYYYGNAYAAPPSGYPQFPQVQGHPQAAAPIRAPGSAGSAVSSTSATSDLENDLRKALKLS